jgi:hypothetical protein
MTLIAAYQEYDTPLLVGDVLITTPFGDEYHTKKIHKISPNFVIGWTGYRDNAMQILPKIYKKFGGKRVQISEIEEYLLNYDVSRFIGKDEWEDKLILSGWVINDEKYCFKWSDLFNHSGLTQLAYPSIKEGTINGSGAKFFKNLLKEKPTINILAPEMSDYAKAVFQSLKEVGALINGEYLADDTSWRNRFGFGYEILAYDGKEFKYVDTITTITVNVLLDDNANITHQNIAPNFFKYKNLGNLSLIQKSLLGSSDIYQYFISRGWDSKTYLENLIESHRYQILPPQSDYYCLTIRFFNPNLCHGLFAVFHANNPFMKVSYIKGIVVFSFSPDFHNLLKEIIESKLGR